MDSKMPKWLLDDNQNRSTEYSRNLRDETFMRELNAHLQDITFSEQGVSDSKPIIFFFGVPRCGKTFFSQMMVHLLDLGYPDNVVARFWKNPVVGIRLSQILQKISPAKMSFESDYGKTKGIFDPHDFAYFWHDHLKKESHPYDFKTAKSKINWENLGKSLSEFSAAFGKTCIMKGVNPSYHINEIAKAYKKSFFIYVKRDFIDSAVSLYKGRLKNYNDENRWYGQTPAPKVYEELTKQNVYDQIGGQFKYLTEMYEEQMNRLNPSQKMILNYEQFCTDPEGVVVSIRKAIQESFGEKIRKKNDLEPGSVKYSTHKGDIPYFEDLLKGIDNFGLTPRLNL